MGGFDVRRVFGQKLSTWGSIIGSCSELNQFYIFVSNLIVKKISSGRQTLFWNDSWLKDIGPLKFRFPRLYAPDLNKKIVAERWSKIDDVWQGNWAWRRQPSGGALADLSSLNIIITGLVLDSTTEDKWTWALEDSGGTLDCLGRVWSLWVKIWSWWGSLSLFNPSLSDILMGSFGFLKDEGASRAFHRVCLTTLWHIWNWRNKVSHATSVDEKNDYCNEDIFLVVQRVSLLWVSNRASKYRVSWNRWIHSPAQLRPP
ncbi:hypothetical protein Tco_0473947 [Tanacetum coccineum]